MNTRASSCDSLDSRDDVVEVKYKVTMLGDTSVGKTSMLVSLEGGDYDAHPRPTVGKTGYTDVSAMVSIVSLR